MSGKHRALRAAAVIAVAAAPLSAVKASAAVETGDANADGSGLAVENTGGNVEFGTGHSESRTIVDGPQQGPVAGNPGARSIAPVIPAKPVKPSNDAAARAKAAVDAARAQAQAQIDAARRQAEEAVQQAHQKSADAQSRGTAQSDAARTQAENSARSGAASAYND